MATEGVTEYTYKNAAAPWWNEYLVAPVLDLASGIKAGDRVLDIGCGNGHIAGLFAERGCAVVGIDPSETGIEAARQAHPNARFEVDLATPDLRDRLGEAPFDLVVSAEVVEHVYDADIWARACFNALRPGGLLVLTTPYHGYLKNLLISVCDKWDKHHTSLDAGSHIKFWSRRTIATLLTRNGFEMRGFRGAGRVTHLWKSMVVSAQRPEGSGAPGGSR